MKEVKDVSPAPQDGLDQVVAPHDAFRIALPNFEGPLDLLLHLIREHKLEVLDIPIALITEKYLAHLEMMRAIDLDIAGEFLVMASTLLHLKSRMLLPREEQPVGQTTEAGVEPGDPRAELVRRLLEYQKYKLAGEQLGSYDILERTVFTRRVPVQEVPMDPEEIGFREVSIYKLIEALDRVLKALEPKKQHEVMRESVSMSQAMMRIGKKVLDGGGERVGFFALFEGLRTRGQVVVTFIAMLEMCKRRFLRVYQDDDGGEILLSAAGDELKALVAEGSLSQAEDIDREYR